MEAGSFICFYDCMRLIFGLMIQVQQHNDEFGLVSECQGGAVPEN